MGFFSFLLLFFAFLYLLLRLAPWLLRFALLRWMKKVNTPPTPSAKKRNTTPSKKQDTAFGEYIDYEEIE